MNNFILVKLIILFCRKINTVSSNLRSETEIHETDLMKLDPFEKTIKSKNNKIIEKNNFLLKMKNRVSKVKEVCSRFHETFNGR